MEKSKLYLYGIMLILFMGLFIGSDEVDATRVHYNGHTPGYGWRYTNDGEKSTFSGHPTPGVIGQPNVGAKMNVFRAAETSDLGDVTLYYNVYTSRSGWGGWHSGGQVAGKYDEQIEAISFFLAGDDAHNYKVVCQPHLQYTGWGYWHGPDSRNNGFTSVGYPGRRLESLRLSILEKNQSIPASYDWYHFPPFVA